MLEDGHHQRPNHGLHRRVEYYGEDVQKGRVSPSHNVEGKPVVLHRHLDGESPADGGMKLEKPACPVPNKIIYRQEAYDSVVILPGRERRDW